MIEQQCLVKTPIFIDKKQCPTNTPSSHLPRLCYYESTGTYILTAILLILHAVTAGIYFAFDRPKPYVPLVPALMTLFPYLFRHRFNSMPHLFHQYSSCSVPGPV
uniref:Serpentine receptor class gamma n=1 Tax=Panagrellus redivivus TaxID=6233 RepID=A0A7E4V743_PANRE